jgi:hypothetical protein
MIVVVVDRAADRVVAGRVADQVVADPDKVKVLVAVEEI